MNNFFPIGLEGKVAAVTGAGGAICGAIADALARRGVSTAVWDLSAEAARKRVAAITAAGGKAAAMACDVLDPVSVDAAAEETLRAFGAIDILINGAGGSRKQATTSEDLSFFDILPDELMRTLALNYQGAVLCSQRVGRILAEKRAGVILNIASIAGLKPLTRAVGYCNGKAALVSFTQWLAVHMAQEYSPKIRVNAMAPGFVLTDQNRFLLVDEKTGEPTERGRQIVSHVPLGRYGAVGEMVGTALWLVSDASEFVTGAVVPVDGGFSAYSGV